MAHSDFKSQQESEYPIAKILALRRTLLENPQSAEAHCDLGVAIIQSGDPKTAIVYFKQALKIDPNHERSHYNLGYCYQKIGFIDNAITAYEAVIRLNPKDEQAWNNLAVLFLHRNEVAEAIELYLKALEINPENSETWASLASAQYLLGRYDDSIQSATKSLALDDSRYWVWLQLGQGYYALHDPENSLHALKKATELNDACDKCWNNLGNAYLLTNDPVQAEECYRKAIQYNGKISDYWFNLGELLFQQESYQEAASCFSRVIQTNEADSEALEYLVKALLETSPLEAAQKLQSLMRNKGERPEYLHMLAQAYNKCGKPDLEAKTRLKLASSQPLDAKNNHALAELLLQQGKRDLAFSFFKNSQLKSEKEPELWYRFAQSFRLDGKLEEEFQCLTRAIKADSTHQASWLRLGQIDLQNNTDSNAIPYFEKAESLLHNDVETWLSTCKRFLGQNKINLALQCSLKLVALARFAPKVWQSIFQLFRHAGKSEDLIANLIEYLVSGSVDASVKTVLGTLIFRQGFRHQALEFLQAAVGPHQHNPLLVHRLAELYLQDGQIAKARELLVESITLKPEAYELLIAMAELELHQNRIEAARASTERALEIRQDHYQAWYLSGMIQGKKNNYGPALDCLEKSLSLNSANPLAWFGKSIMLQAKKQDYEAEMSLLKAVQLDRRLSEAWSALACFKLANSEYGKARFLLLRALAANDQNQSAWSLLAKVFDFLGAPEKSQKCREIAQNLASTQNLQLPQ